MVIRWSVSKNRIRNLKPLVHPAPPGAPSFHRNVGTRTGETSKDCGSRGHWGLSRKNKRTSTGSKEGELGANGQPSGHSHAGRRPPRPMRAKPHAAQSGCQGLDPLFDGGDLLQRLCSALGGLKEHGGLQLGVDHLLTKVPRPPTQHAPLRCADSHSPARRPGVVHKFMYDPAAGASYRTQVIHLYTHLYIVYFLAEAGVLCVTFRVLSAATGGSIARHFSGRSKGRRVPLFSLRCSCLKG